MKRSISLVIVGVMLLSAVSTVMADDLAFVTLTDRHQATLAQDVLGTAFTRDYNRFLVSVSDAQARALGEAGMKIEIVMEDIDPDEVFIVRHSDGRKGIGVDVPQLGQTLTLSDDVQVVRMSPSTARLATDGAEITASALSERSIPISFLPVFITNTLAQVTDFPTDSLVNLISQDSIYAMNLRLENFETRYIFTDSILAARDWMVQKFTDWGYTDISTPSFWYPGGGGVTCYNVKVVKPGYAEPDKVIVIGGHYDAITYGQPTDPMDYAPGADDDGSGTTMTLEMARVLKDVPLRKTVIFMPFSAEEVGLYGSYDAASDFYYSGTDLEVMYNYDMVGYNGNGLWQFEVSSGPNQAYKFLSMATNDRVNTNLITINSAPGGSSDHFYFMDFGFNIVNNIEEDFNYPGWHTNLDLTTEMDFPYMYEVARMTIASLAIVANAAYPTEIDEIVDMGDGQSLNVSWAPCDPNYTYKLYYGPTSGVYTDTIETPSGVCTWLVQGLTEGQQYYFSAVGEVAGGYPAVYATEFVQTPLVIPRAPTSVHSDPGLSEIIVDWADNAEADFDHYRIYRGISSLPFSLYADNVTTSAFTDTDVIGQTEYSYRITAVDGDGYESDLSAPTSSYAASFDGGVLVVDEMRQGGGMPNQTVQEAFFADLFQPTHYDLARVENSGAPVTRNLSGQYSSVFWLDDDFSPKLLTESQDTLDWYLDLSGNILVSGLQTIEYLGAGPLSPGDFFYDHFRVADFNVNTASDFAGATGVGGWPDVFSDTTSILGFMPFIPALSIATGGEPIYLFDSKTDDPSFEGAACALYYDGPQGKRIVLGFPLYFLTDESAQALIAHAKTLFGESAVTETDGDVDGSGRVDIGDLVYMVDYIFLAGPPPLSMNAADVDASCRIDISDLVYFVEYIFRSGPPPLAGCVE